MVRRFNFNGQRRKFITTTIALLGSLAARGVGTSILGGAALSSSAGAEEMRPVELEIATGKIRGLWENDVAVFRGLPFAQPPVGKARFLEPLPVKPWEGVRDAFKFGPPPPQGSVGGPPPPWDPKAGDEWLTVNVWSPSPEKGAKLPVMVWIYGGAWVIGESGDPAYDGARLAHEGGVIVVTLNYRVGVEGFAQIEGAPANRGLLDQVAALQWVKDNIAAFGGDPGNVTIFGESAGGGSVAALLAMPRAAGLFHRAIAQSVPSPFFSTELADDISKSIAAELGLKPTMADLANVAPDKLISAATSTLEKSLQYESRWGLVSHTPTVFSPVIDGDVLPATPWEALSRGVSKDIELIVGHTREEYNTFLLLGGMLGKITSEQASTALRVFGPDAKAEQAYRTAFPSASAEQLAVLVQSDRMFRMPSLHLAEAHIAGGGRAYVYELTWPAPVLGGALGACHGLDVPLTFGVFAGPFATMILGDKPSPETEGVSKQFRNAWTAFAKVGDPGWPAYDLDKRLVQIIDVVPSVEPYPEETSRQLWKDEKFDALPLL